MHNGEGVARKGQKLADRHQLIALGDKSVGGGDEDIDRRHIDIVHQNDRSVVRLTDYQLDLFFNEGVVLLNSCGIVRKLVRRLGARVVVKGIDAPADGRKAERGDVLELRLVDRAAQRSEKSGRADAGRRDRGGGLLEVGANGVVVKAAVGGLVIVGMATDIAAERRGATNGGRISNVRVKVTC